MSKILVATIAGVALLLYLGTAFINWDANPGKWGDGTRFIVFGLWCIISGVTIKVYVDMEEENK